MSIGIVNSVVDLERPWPASAYSGRFRKNCFWFEKIVVGFVEIVVDRGKTVANLRLAAVFREVGVYSKNLWSLWKNCARLRTIYGRFGRLWRSREYCGRFGKSVVDFGESVIGRGMS